MIDFLDEKQLYKKVSGHQVNTSKKCTYKQQHQTIKIEAGTPENVFRRNLNNENELYKDPPKTTRNFGRIPRTKLL